MTGEEMERAIEFLVNQHAKVSAGIDELKEAQIRIGAHIASLADQTQEQFQMFTEEMREAFNKLILSNEVTRDLSNQVARLAIETSRRVTVLEDKLL